MASAFLGEIRLFPLGFAPRNWAFCNGQLLAIAQNQALFSLLGTTYGGNGQTTFALPDLRTRTPMGFSNAHPLGEASGESQHTLTVAELPAHTHPATAHNQAGDNLSPVGRGWGLQPVAQSYGSPGTGAVAMSPQAITQIGASQPHENRPPYLVLSFCIALTGVFPSRN